MKRVLALALFLCVTLTASPAGAAGNPNPGITLPPQARLFGRTLSEWVDQWFTWSVEVPADQNTVFHPENCQLNQGGKVFYLPTSISLGVHFDCTVPAGAHILVFVGGTIDWLDANLNTEAKVRQDLESALTHLSTVRASVDGQRLRDLRRYFVESPHLFTVDLPEGALFGLPPGPLGFLGGGIFLMLRPLSVGEHTIRLFDAFDDGFQASSLTHLTIVPHT